MRLRLAILITCLALPASAEAGVTWVVKGRGFGHGVGMSQYGAFGFAKHGKGHRFILRHYYTGTTVAGIDGPRVVRVLVAISRRDLAFSGARRACGVRLQPRLSYLARRAGASVRLRRPGGGVLGSCGRRLRAVGDGAIRIAGTAYRGALEVVPTRGDARSLNAVNAVPVDQYVKGVIANESPASWPMAALRAQAVAARSYALATQVDRNGFDLYSDTRSQVYDGIKAETARTNRAANETKGEVVLHGKEIAQTFFSACSGGHTESVQNVFYGPSVPYLVGVPDPFDHYCPLHTWRLRFSGREISSRLGAHLKGRLKRVLVTRRGASPRIVWARLLGTGGATRIRGDRLAAALGAYDRWMTFCRVRGAKRRCSGAGGKPPPSGGVAG